MTESDGVRAVTAFAGAALNVPKRAVHRTTVPQSGDFEDSVAAAVKRAAREINGQRSREGLPGSGTERGSKRRTVGLGATELLV